MAAALLASLLAASPAATAAADAAAKTPGEIVDAAPAPDWRTVEPDALLVMDLAPDARGGARQLVIQLMPPPLSQPWVANVRTLAAAGWWDGLAIDRVQDNYVVQWGAPDDGRKPPALWKVAQDDYAIPAPAAVVWRHDGADAYAAQTGFLAGWPVAGDGRSIWPVHCYAMVGVGRDMPPDAGSGTELYAVIGHAPRHLDRNIALVGRVVQGIEHLSSLPRGTGALGFYEQAAEKLQIRRVRIASDLPRDAAPAIRYLDTGSVSFAAYAEARRNRRDGFFVRPAGGADICNIPVPIQASRR